jgi:O-antigen/teichoic acid export membrane protein
LSVSRHTGYNLIGAVIPIALSLITVPIYLKLVGTDRYGVLAIAWLLLGYFGLFDLGLGRATSYRVAALRDSTPQARADTFWAALATNALMGIVGGLLLWAAAGYFFGHVFKVDERLRPEMLSAVPLLAASVPIATLTGVLGGALGGRERFLELNVISVISTAMFQLIPLGLAWTMGPNLVLLLSGALAARLLAAAYLAFRSYAELGARNPVRLKIPELKVLLRYGGWVTLAGIFAPLLIMVDRFAIGAVLGARSVSTYTVPYQLASRIQILPSSLTTAMFPRLSSAAPEEQGILAEKAMRTLSSLLFTPFIGAIFIIEPFLHIWVGRNLDPQAAAIGRIMLLGMWANAFALISFTRIEASGRPDLIVKIMLIEIPPYFTLLYFGMTTLGLMGAACAATARFVIDFVLMTWVADGRIRSWRSHLGSLVFLSICAWLAALWTIADWRWWVAAVVSLSIASAWSLYAMPESLRAQGLAYLEQFRRRWMGARQGS